MIVITNTKSKWHMVISNYSSIIFLKQAKKSSLNPREGFKNANCSLFCLSCPNLQRQPYHDPLCNKSIYIIYNNNNNRKDLASIEVDVIVSTT